MDILNKVVDMHIFNKGSIIGLIIGVLGSLIYKRIDSYVYSDGFTYKINRVRKAKPSIKKKNIKNNTYPDKINNFVNTMSENIKEENLVNLYNNLDSLKIINDYKTSVKMSKAGISGEYFSKSNKIRINELSDFDSIDHELMHMASNKREFFHKNTGFSQSTKPFLFKRRLIGNGLNEGYTQLLTERLFETNYVSAYHYLVSVVEYLEEIVGKDAMERFYFNSDLRSLINELSNYTDKDTILELIEETDNLLYIIRLRELYIEELSNCLVAINHLLIKINYNKEYKDFVEGRITEEEMNKKLSDFDDSLNLRIRVDKGHLNIITERTKKYLNKNEMAL